MSIAVNIHLEAKPDEIAAVGGSCNPHLVCLEFGRYGSEGNVYLNPEQARRIASVLLADAVRCETWHAERALAAPAEPVPADLDEVLF